MLNYYYITLKPEVIKDKKGRSSNVKYLVISHPSVERLEFVNDENEFDAVDKHYALFAGLYEQNTSVTVNMVKPDKPEEPSLIKKGTK